MSWFWTIIFLINFANIFSEAKHHTNPPSAVVVGTVYCDTCFHQDFPKASQFIEGATVAVECKDANFRQEVKTDKNGEFQVHLPIPISKHINKIKNCSVKLIKSNKPYCSIASTASSSSLHLKSRSRGTHIFSAGYFTFKPLKQPQLCDQKPTINNFNTHDKKFSPIPNSNIDPAFPPPLQDPPSDSPALGRFFPPLPRLPTLPSLPSLPRLPPLPEMPILPPKTKNEPKPTKDSQLSDKKVDQPTEFPFPPNPFNPIFPPNPLLPPPSLLPPNPFQPPPSIIPPIFPSPPPSIFPPLFPSPPSPPFFHLPPFPSIVPSPPPPPPPVFPIPLPPFPFQPTPGLPGPGVPPAEVSSHSKKRSP